ncbi:hypothetical protein GPECTOR_5g249 [Gonium pectorale]|uniref:Uncharacterized protein n=1 Tax=Gonium pectorale TaxID=33097 RepID=A0A150GXT1_GONPE|nr:hypothetical protein GPECTOR_5g249 [Gonium pectorale]|eukprot:KXZ54150.1 hypothetical protein GPECTOR_5g249 [Gonium pectorale]
MAATSIAAVNRITEGDYRQVVLVGDAMDTRPYRLPWPPGTAIFLVAPPEAHAAAEAALRSEAAAAITAKLLAETTATTGPAEAAAAEAESASSSSGGGILDGEAANPRALSMRPVRARFSAPSPCPQGGCPSLLAALAAAGFRADRLSVWGLQGLEGLELKQQEVEGLVSSAALCAAYHSLLFGELPSDVGGRAEAENALADCGLLGAPIAFGGPDSSYGVWRPAWGPPPDAREPQRWLFAAQQIRLSAAQMDTYTAHREAAEDLDEDFFDNFS